jgi:putative membrane protein
MTVIDAKNRFDVTPSVSNHFAWIRTRFALERTYMAWVRTGISLISFGFTIVQFFQRMQGMSTINGRVMSQSTPRDFGLALIATGVGALALSSWQYYRGVRYLRSPPFASLAADTTRPHHSAAFISAMVIMAIGIAAFVAVFFRFL